MKQVSVEPGKVTVKEIGVSRAEFEPPIFVGTALLQEIARRRARSRGIREQNHREGHK